MEEQSSNSSKFPSVEWLIPRYAIFVDNIWLHGTTSQTSSFNHRHRREFVEQLRPLTTVHRDITGWWRFTLAWRREKRDDPPTRQMASVTDFLRSFSDDGLNFSFTGRQQMRQRRSSSSRFSSHSFSCLSQPVSIPHSDFYSLTIRLLSVAEIDCDLISVTGAESRCRWREWGFYSE